ncbi:MAG: TIGR01777 family oxidoreductase [Cellvibrionales bacterium]|jgi:hypothetical protein
MRILITGGTGFIGTALTAELLKSGHDIWVLTRQQDIQRPGVVFVSRLDDIPTAIDAVVNLAGASLADRRWSEAYKSEMVASRAGFTEKLVGWMGELPTPPRVLISGSAIGYYGSSRSARFDEASPPGSGFSASLCRAWESAAGVAESEQTRVITLRLGVVFDREGGALQPMMRSFRFGIGSWVGDGDQWLSWVHRGDVVSAILFLLDNESQRGAYNLTAPNPVTHRDFCRILSARKPTLFSAGVPGFLMRAALGEMADELLLEGQHVSPNRLQAEGFRFRFASLDSALTDIIAREKAR